MRSPGLYRPRSSAAAAVIGLNDEPVAYCPNVARSKSGGVVADERVQVERRAARDREDLPGVRILRDERALPLADVRLRRALHHDVEREHDVVPRYRRRLAERLHERAVRLDDGEAPAVRPTEDVVERVLE